MNSRQAPFWLLTCAAAGALMLPRLASEGLFMDGLLYAVIARNLAAGVGSFWHPHCTQTLFSDFYEHPPLGLGIESLFFRVLGEGYLVESVYSVATALACAAMIVAVWRLATTDTSNLRAYGWLPVFFWVATPQIAWTYSYNLLENTMSVFTLIAVYLVLRAQLGSRRAWPYMAMGALAITAAVLTKGPVGFFPLATLPCYWLATRRISFARAALHTLLLLAGVVAVFAVLMSIEDARHNLTSYFTAQLSSSMVGERGGVGSRFQIVEKLFSEIAPAIVITVIVLLIGWRKRFLGGLNEGVRGWALTLALIGLCGSLPVVASPRQSTFYIVPAFPFFALALALVAAPPLRDMLDRVNPRSLAYRIFTGAAVVAFLAVVVHTATLIGTVGREEPLIGDVKKVGVYITSAEAGDTAYDDRVVSICPELYAHWSLHGYMSRYFSISLDRNLTAGAGDRGPMNSREPSLTSGMRRFLLAGENCRDVDLSAYTEIPLDLELYRLYVLH